MRDRDGDRKISVKGPGFEENLLQFRKDTTYTDVCLRTEDGREFPCHRVILAAKSEYFHLLFSGGFRETKESTIPIKGVSSAIMAIILKFIYTSECKFGYDHCIDLLLAANMMQVKDLEFLIMNEVSKYCGNVAHYTSFFPGLLYALWEFSRERPVLGRTLTTSSDPRHLSAEIQIDESRSRRGGPSYGPPPPDAPRTLQQIVDEALPLLVHGTTPRWSVYP